eukprot:2703774-Amphidinium_carterae.1
MSTFFLSDTQWRQCRALILLLADVELPMMHAHTRQEEMCGSIRGAGGWHAEQAVGDFKHLSEMVQLLQDSKKTLAHRIPSTVS